MSAPESDEEEIEVQFRDLCLAVNLDKQTMELAWQSYESAKTNYTLEVCIGCKEYYIYF